MLDTGRRVRLIHRPAFQQSSIQHPAASLLRQHLLQLGQRARQHHPHGPVGLAELLGDLLRRQPHQVPQPQGLALVLGQRVERGQHAQLPLVAREGRAGVVMLAASRLASPPAASLPSGIDASREASRFWLSKCRRWASMIFRSQIWNSQCSGSQFSSGALSSERHASRQASCRMSSASVFLARCEPMRLCRNANSAGRLASTNSASAASSPDRSRATICRIMGVVGSRIGTTGSDVDS